MPWAGLTDWLKLPSSPIEPARTFLMGDENTQRDRFAKESRDDGGEADYRASLAMTGAAVRRGLVSLRKQAK